MVEPPFEVLEHTADIGIRIFGTTLPELFQNAALAVQSIAVDANQTRACARYEIAAAGEDIESLLVNWLNEVIYYLDGKRIVISRLEIGILSPTSISASAWGEPRDAVRHRAQIVVKAATYHQLSLTRTGGRYIAEVFLDI